MDSDIAWEECVGDIPLDTKNLPPLNALSTTSSSHLPDIDLLHLLTFDSSDAPRSPPPDSAKLPRLSSPPPTNPPTPESTSLITTSSPSHSSLSNPSQTSLHNLSADHQPILSPPPSPQQQQQRHDHSSPASSTQSPPLTDQSQLVLELSTRLASAGAEATALRKRVAALTSENRALRCALDHANARLIAVAQAASSAHPTIPSSNSQQPPPPPPPVMLGVAHMTSDIASRLTGALTVSDANLQQKQQPLVDEQGRDRKKRKRMTNAAATTMACVMFMWGALVGSPGLLSSSSTTPGSDGNLPAVWKGEYDGANMGNVPVPSVRGRRGGAGSRMTGDGHGHGHWQPNCMRVLEQLPDGSEEGHGRKRKREEEEEEEEVEWIKAEPRMMVDENGQEVSTVTKMDNELFVDVEDKASAAAVSLADARDPRQPVYSYVLLRDSKSAMSNVKACRTRMGRGEACEEPHTISLILPAEAAGLEMEENDTESYSSLKKGGLVEVQCSITAVGRIPDGLGQDVGQDEDSKALLGRVIATVPETGTVITH